MIRSIGELPFVERPARDVLHLLDHRDQPVADYGGFGFCRVVSIGLEDAAEGLEIVEDVVVLALHSADAGEPHGDDVELEFVLDPAEPSVTVLLSAFLARWLPRLPTAGAVVLAMCNPHRATLPRPAALTGALYYAVGDVESWREPDAAPELRLRADSWRVAE